MKTISDNIKPILALIIVILGFAYFYITDLLGVTTQNDSRMAIFGLMSMAAGYYFASSTGQSKKDDIIQDLAKKQ